MDVEQSHDSAKPCKSYLSKSDLPVKIYCAHMHTHTHTHIHNYIHVVIIGKAKFGEVTCIIRIATVM